MPRVNIVIVNYNGENYQNECIRTIYSMKYTDFQVIVVDSGSTDNSIQKLREEFPDVKVILCNENVGVAKGNNIGIEESIKSGAEYTLLMNNDVEIDSELLGKLISCANEHTITVPKIYYYDPKDILWFGGGELDWKKGNAIHYGMDEKDNGQYNKRKIITYSPTCCMLINNTIFDDVGRFDEDLFMYYDDTDFCARLSDTNIKILYVPDAYLWHKVSSSSGGGTSRIKVYYMFRNQFYYIKKHKKKLKIGAKVYVYFRAFAKYLLSPIVEKNNKYIKDAYIDYTKGKTGRRNFGKGHKEN